MDKHGCKCCQSTTSRRTVVTGIGAGLVVGPGVALAQGDPKTLRPRAGDLLIRDGDKSLTPLTPKDIPLSDAPVSAWAMEPAEKIVRDGSRLNGLIVQRFDPAELKPQTKDRSAEGVVAYTQICTHNGCDITDWVPATKLVQCACHFTLYDPRDAARIVDGPAPRALPALPLKVEDGKLVVAAAFSDRVGFEQP